MKIQDKIILLLNNHLSDWYKVRQIVKDEISIGQMSLCCCGRLATGFHESTCKKFKNKVDRETVKRLEHLIKKDKTL
jgi:hypothetical protein